MAQNLFDINGKVTVMTGACGVLGATIVKYFASQGSKVVLLDLERARETGEKIVAEIKAAGGEAMFLPTNVLDEATVEQNCKDIVAAYGSVDILLNGAGGNMGPANVAPDQTIFDMDLDATRKVFELNIIGAIILRKSHGSQQERLHRELLLHVVLPAADPRCRLRHGQIGPCQLDTVAGR